MAVINGTNLFVKSGTAAAEVLIAASTGFTITVNQNMIDSTTKDSSKWAENLDGNRSWSVTCDFLYDPTGTNNFIELVDLIIADTNTMSIVAGDDATSGEVNWSGNVRIDTTSITANDNDAAGGSVSFIGNGALTKNTVI